MFLSSEFDIESRNCLKNVKKCNRKIVGKIENIYSRKYLLKQKLPSANLVCFRCYVGFNNIVLLQIDFFRSL